MSQKVLDVKNITFRYDDRMILEHISLQLFQGEMLGLVGPNGSGKSTLLKVILGLLPLQTGEVSWFGKGLKEFKNWSKVGYVSQKANSFNTGFPATVQEVVTMGLTGKLGLFRRPGKEENQKVREVLQTVGMENYLNQNIGQLSGGQQQRVFIARALVSDPEVLILDEPTVGVDTKSEEHFYELLIELNREKNLSMILVSHDMGVVSKQMHSIACLNQRIHFHGASEEFEKNRNEILLKAYGHDVHVLHHEH